MPIYEYRCADCGAHLEKMQKITDAPLTVCEACGGRLEKQISRAGFQFKGSGWYVTDYSNKGKSEAQAEAKTETETKSDAKTEKTSAGESTTKTDTASKPLGETSPKTSKTE